MLKISLIFLFFLSGCMVNNEDMCLNKINDRINTLTPSPKVEALLKKMGKSYFCKDIEYKFFYNEVNKIKHNLNFNEQQEFFTFLFFIEFHSNYNAGEYMDYLNLENIKVSKLYNSIINDNEKISKLKLSKEEVNNLNIIKQSLKDAVANRK